MKQIFVILFVVIVFISVGCRKRDMVIQTSNEEKNVDDTFVGEFGYILPDNVYDYSNRFAKSYVWLDGVKLPFEKPKDWNAKFDGYGLYCEEVKYLEYKKFITDMTQEGYVFKKNVKEETIREERGCLFKDNIIIEFYVEEYDTSTEMIGRLEIYVYTGNVKGERKVTVDKARDLLDKGNYINANQNFKDYVLIEVQNDNIINMGYYEFLVHSPEKFNAFDESTYPYYVLINDVGILLCTQVGEYHTYPIISNVYKKDDEVILNLVFTKFTNTSIGTFVSYIEEYVLEGKEFVLENSMELENEVILAKIVDSKMKYYSAKFVRDFSVEMGKKNVWVIDKEYHIE